MNENNFETNIERINRLIIGIIVFLWGCLIQEGFQMQSELDDVL